MCGGAGGAGDGEFSHQLGHAGFGSAPRVLGTEPDGSIVFSWAEGRVPTETDS